MKKIIALLIIPFIYACGGGGGSSHLIQTDSTSTEHSSDVVFGSVVHSFTGFSLPKVTSVDTYYDGSRYIMEVNRKDGSFSRIDSAYDLSSRFSYTSPRDNPMSHRHIEGFNFSSLDARGLITATVFIETSATNYNDYLAFGYWGHLDAALLGVETGSFIEGPDYDQPITVPFRGTATYTGVALGKFSTYYSSGSAAKGNYGGVLGLTANFSNNTVSGRISDILYANTEIFYTNGHTAELEDRHTDYAIELGTAIIDRSGQFSSTNVNLTHPYYGISFTEGEWAGRFSETRDSRGNPRGVAGTHQGYVGYPSGTREIFIGAHYGTTERFR